jgi:hypothetical protein
MSLVYRKALKKEIPKIEYSLCACRMGNFKNRVKIEKKFHGQPLKFDENQGILDCIHLDMMKDST